jgi:hypothetical protein
VKEAEVPLLAIRCFTMTKMRRLVYLAVLIALLAIPTMVHV